MTRVRLGGFFNEEPAPTPKKPGRVKLLKPIPPSDSLDLLNQSAGRQLDQDPAITHWNKVRVRLDHVFTAPKEPSQPVIGGISPHEEQHLRVRLASTLKDKARAKIVEDSSLEMREGIVTGNTTDAPHGKPLRFSYTKKNAATTALDMLWMVRNSPFYYWAGVMLAGAETIQGLIEENEKLKKELKK